MKDNYEIKTYEEILDWINGKILSDPRMMQKEINRIEAEIAQLDNEIISEQEATIRTLTRKKYNNKLIPKLEVDFYKSTITYKEVTPNGEVALEKTRNIKPRDDF